jgi:glycosyltransferase involved in cell wall biosynthesis
MRTLSVVEAIWNLPPYWLDYNLKSLSSQTNPPLEIVVTNTSSDDNSFAGIEAVCAKYPLVRMIAARRNKLNISHALNVGIKAAHGEYVMLTSIDRIFSANFLERVYGLMGPNYMVHSTSHNLPEGMDMGDVDTLMDRWDEILEKAVPSEKYAIGSIVCVERAWLLKVHGLDEEHCPFLYCDSDLIRRGDKDGWDDTRHVDEEAAKILTGDRDWRDKTRRIDRNAAHILHIGHPSRIGAGYGGFLPDKSYPVVRNPNGWGER